MEENEVLEGEITAPVLTDADEQVMEPAEAEEKAIDIEELMFNKFLEIKEQRYSAVSTEDRQKGVRLLRLPYDSLHYETLEEFKEELSKIKGKVSRLSASQRSAMMMLQQYVISEMIQAQAHPAEGEDSESRVEEVNGDAPATSDITE